MKSNKSTRRWLLPLLCVTGCVLLSFLACWHSLTYNGGRLVYPMDTYSFQPSDIPMLLSIALDFLCGIYLLVLLLRPVLRQRRRQNSSNRTRRLNPRLGLLGLLGFLGFLGFWSQNAWNDYTPFCFFIFFGFFGFFFEGKMSNTLMDERYRENVQRAQLDAYRIGFSIIFLLLIIAGQVGRAAPGILAAVLLTGISLTLALVLFLGEYLLYRYDKSEFPEEE